jgi:hypothetical protein
MKVVVSHSPILQVETLLPEAPPVVVHPSWHLINWFCSDRSCRCRGKATPTFYFAHGLSNVRELYSLRLQSRLQVS